jgi:hypothetical protein
MCYAFAVGLIQGVCDLDCVLQNKALLKLSAESAEAAESQYGAAHTTHRQKV